MCINYRAYALDRPKLFVQGGLLIIGHKTYHCDERKKERKDLQNHKINYTHTLMLSFCQNTKANNLTTNGTTIHSSMRKGKREDTPAGMKPGFLTNLML